MKTVFVLGNARSGTSMAAGIISYLGVNLNHDIDPLTDSANGAFENQEMNVITTRFHQAYLNKDLDEKKDELIERVRTFVQVKKSELWGWKSALTHWHLPYFIKEVENLHLIITTRNPYHTAVSWKSHMKRNYNEVVSMECALQNIAEGHMALVENVNKVSCPKIWTTYEDIKKNSLLEAEKIANFLNIDFTEQMKVKICNFIVPEFTTIKE